jgi:hypothetical protein
LRRQIEGLKCIERTEREIEALEKVLSECAARGARRAGYFLWKKTAVDESEAGCQKDDPAEDNADEGDWAHSSTKPGTAHEQRCEPADNVTQSARSRRMKDIAEDLAQAEENEKRAADFQRYTGSH